MFMTMSMTMTVIIMPIPRMTQTLKEFYLFNLYSRKPRYSADCRVGVDKNKNEYYQEHSTVLFSPVENPEPKSRKLGYVCDL